MVGSEEGQQQEEEHHEHAEMELEPYSGGHAHSGDGLSDHISEGVRCKAEEEQEEEEEEDDGHGIVVLVGRRRASIAMIRTLTGSMVDVLIAMLRTLTAGLMPRMWGEG
jgi:predicted GTPase